MSIRVQFDITKGDFRLQVDLDLPARGVTALFGRSGSGKTTLLRAIAGLEKKSGGYLRIGENVWNDTDICIPAHQRPLGYVIQEAGLFPHLSVRKNLEYGYNRISPEERKISLDKAVKWLNIGPLLERSPGTLSGGERQRVAIARALAVSPGLLLMDEPLASLDQEGRQEILPYLDRLHAELEIPVIYVSHNLEEVTRLADHLVLLEKGQVVAAGGIHEMLTRLDTPLALGADAASVIDATVSGYDPVYQLNRLEFSGGQLTLPGNPLGKGIQVRLRFLARDVSLVLERPTATSIQNIFPATVDALHRDGALVTVRLMAGGVPLLSRITLKSMDALDLHPGKTVFAQVKSVVLFL